MIYLLDGYNLLFALAEADPFAQKREELIAFLQNLFAQNKLQGLLIFDGMHHRNLRETRSYRSPLEIVYTPEGQNADSYILEKLTGTKTPQLFTLVTNDLRLAREAKSLGASSQTVAAFLQTQRKRKPTAAEKPTTDTPSNLKRLRKLFESD